MWGHRHPGAHLYSCLHVSAGFLRQAWRGVWDLLQHSSFHTLSSYRAASLPGRSSTAERGWHKMWPQVDSVTPVWHYTDRRSAE